MGVRRSALNKALEPLEALALKMERVLENANLGERLMRAERLAGLGLLAEGMAHALNNPLTAVLGFAELIAATTGEQRVKEDAEIIVREAQRMRQTVETLLEFWRPAAQSEAAVDMRKLVRELAEGCGGAGSGRCYRERRAGDPHFAGQGRGDSALDCQRFGAGISRAGAGV